MKPVYKLYIIIFSLTLTVHLHANEKYKYKVSDIPAELLKNANAVMRDYHIDYEIDENLKATSKMHIAITILKEGALEESLFHEFYNRFMRISDIEGIVYDEFGKKIKRIKNEDIIDASAINGFSIYEDSRRKYIDPRVENYPFTVEYTYTKHYKSLFFMPRWPVFHGYNIATENTSFKITYPTDYKLRYIEKNLRQEAITNQVENQKIIKWQHKHFPALNYEPLSLTSDERYPCVFAAPSLFEIDDKIGSFESWESVGRFFYRLLEGRDIISQETKDEISALLEGVESEREKVAIIYQYAQKKNRYISIQEGIGGWQPIPAQDVDKLSYGDCKALSNYTKALLKEFGIPSIYTTVYAGDYPLSPPKDFAMNRFNHAILCVPQPKDTIWLECTNSHSPCGYIGDFTDDRYVLLIEEDGGKLVKTPAYTVEDNNTSTAGEISFTANGAAQVQATIKYKGVGFGDEARLQRMDEKDRRKAIIKSIDVANPTLNSYNIAISESKSPILIKQLDFSAANYLTKVGQLTFFKVNMLNSQGTAPRYARNRKNEVYIKRNFSENDSLTYLIPENLKIESIPQSKELRSPYGYYRTHIEQVNNQITYKRTFHIYKGIHPPEAYNEFRDFLEKVAESDEAKCVLTPKS
jgi:SHS2 domain-containing protein